MKLVYTRSRGRQYFYLLIVSPALGFTRNANEMCLKFQFHQLMALNIGVDVFPLNIEPNRPMKIDG
jgi:hypothetical protein